MKLSSTKRGAVPKGVLTPIITPFDSKGKIDFRSLCKVIDFVINKQKTKGIVVCGTTGEVCQLDNKEYSDVIKKAISHINLRVPVIAGVESKKFNDTLKRIKMCNNFALDSLLIPPIGKGLSQQKIFEQFIMFSKASKQPIIVYNKNKKEGSYIKTETITKICCLKNVIAVKDSGENLDQAKKILKNKNRDFYFLSGCDKLNLDVFNLGGEGTISAASHLLGKQISNLLKLSRKNRKKADKLNFGLLPKITYLFQVQKPGLIKKVYKKIGVISSDYMRISLDFSKACFDKEIEENICI